MVKSVDIYRGNSVCLAVLREGCRPRAVGYQFGHCLSGCICGHCAGGEKSRKGASAERRRPAGTCGIGSNSAANSCLTRVTCRKPVMA